MSDLIFDGPGFPIAYDVTGDGPIVIAAHGLFSSRAGEDVLGLFDHSAAAVGRRLVRYDAPGHGRSGGRDTAEDYRWSRLAESLLALLDELGADEPVDAIGASMGTATVLWAATMAPHRFRRLVLTIPPTAWQTRTAQADQYRAMDRLVAEHGRAALVRAFAAGPDTPIMAAAVESADHDEDRPAVELPDVTAPLLRYVLAGAAASDLPDPDRLSVLKHPVLVLPWTDDPGHPMATAERLGELLPNAVVEPATDLAGVRGWGRRTARFLA